ncbi:MAG: hypothetical protein R3272_09510 [Candidatus Promineifilaceae bacterium]|nr:hypothetical protein [Candidatus Promineifilaceae bacterium]
MSYRGLMDRKGEQFAYLHGTTLYTLDDEVTGRLQGNYIVDMEGSRMWRVEGDAVYTLEGEPVGYFGAERRDELYD